MEDPNIHDQVQKYLSGGMTAEERQSFEEACRLREELREALTLEVQTRFAIQQAGRASLEGESFPVTPSVPKSSFSWYRMAAAFLGLILLGISLYLFWPKPQTSAELFATYYSAPILSQVRDSEGLDSLLLVAFSSYTAEDWPQAASAFEAYLEGFNYRSDSQAFLALGICYMEMGQYDKAQEYFSKISLPASPYYYDARWYAALSYLKVERLPQCQAQLKQLAASNVYRKKAEELLKKMEP